MNKGGKKMKGKVARLLFTCLTVTALTLIFSSFRNAYSQHEKLKRYQIAIRMM